MGEHVQFKHKKGVYIAKKAVRIVCNVDYQHPSNVLFIELHVLKLHNLIELRTAMGVFDWASSVTYVLTDWTFLTILYSTGTGNEAM